MKEDHIEGCLTEDRGRGWHASCVGKNWVRTYVNLLLCTHIVITLYGLHSMFYKPSGSCVQVGLRDIEYMQKFKGDELDLQNAVEEHLYPPAICHDVVQSEVPRHLQSHKRIDLHIHGAKEGEITFPIDFLEEKEGVC